MFECLLFDRGEGLISNIWLCVCVILVVDLVNKYINTHYTPNTKTHYKTTHGIIDIYICEITKGFFVRMVVLCSD